MFSVHPDGTFGGRGQRGRQPQQLSEERSPTFDMRPKRSLPQTSSVWAPIRGTQRTLDGQRMRLHPSTTLAESFEGSAEGSRAVRASIGRRASEGGENGAADRGQCRLGRALKEFSPPLASARRRLCRQAYAIIVMSAWRCRPCQDRPWKWSRPSSSLSCWWACSQTHRALIAAASVLRLASGGRLER